MARWFRIDDSSYMVDSVQSKWGWFLVLGVVLILGGLLAIMLPAISTIAASLVLGVVLSLSGVVKIIKAFRVTGWPGFLWELTAGVVEVICGVLIYLNPLKGAIAITVLIAIVFVLVGISQIGLALRVRPQQGWQWLVISGLIALLASAALTLKIPYTRFYTPGTIAGISILFAGLAYVAMGIAVRGVQR